MIGLDTNVLVRYVTQDDPEQAEAAGQLIESQCTRESPGLVSVVVLSELVWVLRGAYDYDKSVVVSVLRQILRTAELAVEDPGVVWSALGDFERMNADFADCLIGHRNHAAGCTETYTFDKKAAHGRYFEMVS